MKRSTLVIITLVLCLTVFGTALAEQEIPVFNGGFEVLPEGVDVKEALGKVPFGWCVFADVDDFWSVELTDEKAKSGKYSAKITLTEAKSGVLLTSKPIEITPGKTYAALWNIFNLYEEPSYVNPIHLYLEFWPEGGWWKDTDYWSLESWREGLIGPWGSSKRVGVQWKSSEKFGEWEEHVIMGTAPANAKYVTISLWVPRRTLKSYVDDVRLALID